MTLELPSLSGAPAPLVWLPALDGGREEWHRDAGRDGGVRGVPARIDKASAPPTTYSSIARSFAGGDEQLLRPRVHRGAQRVAEEGIHPGAARRRLRRVDDARRIVDAAAADVRPVDLPLRLLRLLPRGERSRTPRRRPSRALREVPARGPPYALHEQPQLALHERPRGVLVQPSRDRAVVDVAPHLAHDRRERARLLHQLRVVVHGGGPERALDLVHLRGRDVDAYDVPQQRLHLPQLVRGDRGGRRVQGVEAVEDAHRSDLISAQQGTTTPGRPPPRDAGRRRAPSRALLRARRGPRAKGARDRGCAVAARDACGPSALSVQTIYFRFISASSTQSTRAR